MTEKETREKEALKLLQAERLTTPIQARAKLLAAYDAADGVAKKAAVLLGISHRSLMRIIADECLHDAVGAIRDRAKARAAKKGRAA